MSNPNPAQNRNALAFGFASPIVGLTSALLIGMAVNDLFGTLDVWVGVVIIAIIGVSLIVGGHFSAVALRDSATHKGAPKAAAVLNLVVVSIWSYVTFTISVTGGIGAIMAIQQWNEKAGLSELRAFTGDDFWNHLLPAQVMFLILLVVLYLFITLRSKGSKS